MIILDLSLLNINTNGSSLLCLESEELLQKQPSYENKPLNVSMQLCNILKKKIVVNYVIFVPPNENYVKWDFIKIASLRQVRQFLNISHNICTGNFNCSTAYVYMDIWGFIALSTVLQSFRANQCNHFEPINELLYDVEDDNNQSEARKWPQPWLDLTHVCLVLTPLQSTFGGIFRAFKEKLSIISLHFCACLELFNWKQASNLAVQFTTSFYYYHTLEDGKCQAHHKRNTPLL